MKKIALIILVILVAIGFSKDFLLKISVEKGAEIATGLPLKIGSFHLGVFNGRVDIKDLKVYNPKGYQDKVMVDIPEIYVACSLPALFNKKIHVQDVRFHLKEFNVITNKNGEVNLNTIKVLSQGSGTKGSGETSQTTGPAPQIQIDNLTLKVGKVTYKNYSVTPAETREFNININEHYENIANTNALISLIIFKTLAKTSIAGLTNIDMNMLKGTMTGAGKVATDTVKGAANTAGEVAEKSVEELKKTTEGLFKTITGPLKSE